MKTVLLIIPNLDFGGAQASFSMVSQLLATKYNVINVVFNKERMAPYRFGGPLRELSVNGASFWPKKIYRFWQRVRRLRELKREYKVDVSVSFLEGADYVNYLSRLGEDVCFYLHGSKMHDANISGALGFIRKRLLIPFFYRRPFRIAVVNKRIAEEMSSNFSVPGTLFHSLPNFFDLDDIRRKAASSLDPETESFFQKHNVICISGRLAPEKGIQLFIPLMPLLLNLIPVKLVLIGDGPIKEQLMRQAAQAGVSYCEVGPDDPIAGDHIIHFLGYRSNPHQYVSRSRLLALPSLNEGMPSVLVEAMAVGTPIVASDCPYGPREILKSDGDFGELLPVITDNNVLTRWCSAIEMLLNDPKRREKYSELGRERAEHYSIANALTMWEGFIEPKR